MTEKAKKKKIKPWEEPTSEENYSDVLGILAEQAITIDRLESCLSELICLSGTGLLNAKYDIPKYNLTNEDLTRGRYKK